MDQCKIDKINELARKSRTCGLTEEEKTLQKALREEYVQAFRDSLTCTLDNTYIQRPDGTREKLKRKEEEP
ncbi:MAG: DUF896 domain-containing protein [Clostridiales bacterium]|nr:DUF896 domain-containing protein [Clostridiales bacterium]